MHIPALRQPTPTTVSSHSLAVDAVIYLSPLPGIYRLGVDPRGTSASGIPYTRVRGVVASTKRRSHLMPFGDVEVRSLCFKTRAVSL